MQFSVIYSVDVPQGEDVLAYAPPNLAEVAAQPPKHAGKPSRTLRLRFYLAPAAK